MSYRPTLLRRDSVSSKWKNLVEQAKEATHTTARPGTILLPTAQVSQSPSQAAAQMEDLTKKFPDSSPDELTMLIDQFHAIPSSKPGWVSQDNAIKALQNAEDTGYNRARETMKTIKTDATEKLELEDWIEFVLRVRSDAAPTMVPGKRSGTYKMKGSHDEISHTIDEDERIEFTEYINKALASDPDVSGRLPLPTDTMQIFDECRDGIIICKLIEHHFPGTINRVMGSRRRRGTSYINLPSGHQGLNRFQIAENNNIAILAAQEIGVNVVNMSGQDLSEGREHLILSLIGQIIKLGKTHKPQPPSKHNLRPVTPTFARRPSTPTRPSVTSHPVTPPRQTITSHPVTPPRQTFPSHPVTPSRPAHMASISPRKRAFSMSYQSVDDDEETRVSSPPPVHYRDKSPDHERIVQHQLRSKLMERGTFKLFEDMKSGIIILETLDKVKPDRSLWASTPTPAPAPRTQPRPITPTAVRKHDTGPKPVTPRPSVRPLASKDSSRVREMGASLGLDEGLIAQRRALLFSPQNRED
ncbi:hypothetical protein CPB86DRAFT_772964 [Serendipita vermifera]|nr:hypothetical protein CPB86DRAFT_772964 [Serendipita vermifera]